MSRHRAKVEEPPHKGAPKWYVGFSTLTTILMTFFITLTMNMGKERELGYAGPGVGAFREAFNSYGLNGVLRGARRLADLVTWGDKYLPEDMPPDAEAKDPTDRLISSSEKDLKRNTSEARSTKEDVSLPLAVHYGPTLDAASRERLASAARLLRQNNSNVLVCARVPVGSDDGADTAYRASQWAMLVGRHLASEEKIASARLTAIGMVGDDATKEATLTLVLRPPGGTAKPVSLTSGAAVHSDIHR